MGRQFAAEFDVESAGFTLYQCLGDQDMLHLGCSDTKGQRPESAVGGCVGIAADHGDAGKGNTQFRPDDVHDSLVIIADVIELNAELMTVFAELVYLSLGHRVLDIHSVCGGGDIVIHC